MVRLLLAWSVQKELAYKTARTVFGRPMRHAPHTVSDLQRALREGTLSASALMARTLAACRAGAPEAWIHRFDDATLLARAQACDAALGAEGPALLDRQPLLGLPFAVKDNIDVAGLPTTSAFQGDTPAPAVSDATAVARLVAAGAIPVGKTNMDQFATGLVGTRSPFGAVPNAFDPARVSGGSSSGSAVVVASGQVPFALGTDTAGSGRVPAGFNQVVGLKPTPGRVGTTGVMPACRTLDCVSVFALTVDDAAQVLAVIEGPDAADPYSAFAPGAARWPQALRVGVPAAPTFTEPAYADPHAAAVAHLRALGHTVVQVDVTPLDRTADLLYEGPWVAERHAALERWLETAPEHIDPAVRTIVSRATRHTATDLFRGQYALQAARHATARLWRDVDVLMVPTAPGHPTQAEVAADPLGANAALGRYTNFVNLLGWCALAVPAGTTAAGLPFGVTFIAPGGADAALARFGADWQGSVGLPLGARGGPLPAPSGASAPATRRPASATLPLVVVGAHLHGLPLHGQLTERDAVFVESTTTSPDYRLFALAGTVPPKPGLQRVASGGAAIAVEVWELPLAHVGSLLALVPPPLGLGSVQLADGRWVHGFVCEAHALAGATDITSFGGWRAWLAAR